MFEVGDRVVVVRPRSGMPQSVIGELATVTKVGKNSIEVEWDRQKGGYLPHGWFRVAYSDQFDKISNAKDIAKETLEYYSAITGEP